MSDTPPIIPSRHGRIELQNITGSVNNSVPSVVAPPIPSRATKPSIVTSAEGSISPQDPVKPFKPFSFKKTVGSFMKDVQELVDTQIVVPVVKTQVVHPNSTPVQAYTIGTTTQQQPIKHSNGSLHSLGMESVALSNQFRSENKITQTLEWCEELYILCLEHSTNMSNQTVPFGHEGFVDRVKRLTYCSKKSAENVFHGSGIESQLPKMAVDGWINSPGHRANLVGEFNRCAVAFHQSCDGKWFATQMFSRV